MLEKNYKFDAAKVLDALNADTLTDFPDKLVDVNQVGTSGERPIHVISMRGDVDAGVALIRAGADVNVVGEMGSTPLHNAARWCRVEMARLLLDHGAKVNVRDKFGQTPLEIAQANGCESIIELLSKGMQE